jgi:hypothetical protein
MSTLRLDAGVHRLDKTMQVGSMRVVGARNFAMLSAFSTFHGKVRNLFILDSFKKNLVAPAANVIDISIALHSGSNK